MFYEGHLPAFSIISFINRGLGRQGVDARLEALFARGIDPDSVDAAVPRSGADTQWPSRDEVLAFGRQADALITRRDRARHLSIESRPAMRRGEALYTALEHEAMHQETLLYMWHRLPHEQKTRPTYLPYEVKGEPPSRRNASGSRPGAATLGALIRADRGTPSLSAGTTSSTPTASTLTAFDIDVHSVTNADYLPFVEAGHVEPPAFWDRQDGQWFWRGMFETHPAAAGLAGLRQPGGRRRLCRLERTTADDRGGVSSRRLWHAVG